MRRLAYSLLLVLAACCAVSRSQAQDLGLYETLARRVLVNDQTTVEVKAYTASRVAPLRIPAERADWERYISEIRERVFNEVIFRGDAKEWRKQPTRVEWLETIPGGPGYRIKKLRYEAVPGMWVPALLYEPENLSGKVPIVVNVNGHDLNNGKAADYKQIRCINQAKRGMLALNVEWLGMGQLHTDGFGHYKMNQLDLVGTAGIAPFYLTMTRSIDIALQHPNADPERLAVTGLSGGGWQTIFVSSLDERVVLSNPVAGYTSFVTRPIIPEMDLGDSEQTPSDLAGIADYTHLTAMRAPRPTLLTFNARDNCCFMAAHALAPLVQGSKPIYELFDRSALLRSHINQYAGHNYGRDNREAFYRMLRDYFYAGSPDFSIEEIPVDDEIKTNDELSVKLPADNQDFHTIALELSRSLPRDKSIPSGAEAVRRGREKLRAITRTPQYAVESKSVRKSQDGKLHAEYWQLQMGDAWTVPAVELAGEKADGTVILVADGGRKSVAGEAREWLNRGRRVIAVDPFYYGESAISIEDHLFAILIASLGERPLGIQAGQIAAAARWARERHGGPVEIHAVGPRTSLAALITGALEADAVDGLKLEESFGSLREVIERDLGANQTPELFCFGLLEAFDIAQIAALARR